MQGQWKSEFSELGEQLVTIKDTKRRIETDKLNSQTSQTRLGAAPGRRTETRSAEQPETW